MPKVGNMDTEDREGPPRIGFRTRSFACIQISLENIGGIEIQSNVPENIMSLNRTYQDLKRSLPFSSASLVIESLETVPKSPCSVRCA
jgi:hypothetical protein